jgi:uncharacterized protein YjbI with pentapeptide repeats
MKVIKPLRLSVLYRSYEDGNACRLAVAVMVYFPFEQPTRLLPEIALWKFVPEQLGGDSILDMGLPKPKGEVLVKGKCFAPGAKPLPGMQVRLRLGSLSKALNVYGNRYWKGARTVPRISDPEPFTEMDIAWQNAFGGADFPFNPLGKGTVPVPVAGGVTELPLPNIEDPRRLIGSPKDRPAPAGFGAYDFLWPQRFSKLGTYDERWKRERFPGFAADLDWSAFNAAPEDQHIAGYLKGGEIIEIFGMHPAKPTVSSRVPQWKVRCFINQQSGSIALREIACYPETLWLFPHAERAVLIYRGVIQIDTDDAFDVKQLVAAIEDPARPKTIEHYRESVKLRLDPKKGVLAAIRDRDLMPEQGPFPPIGEEEDPFTPLLTPKLLMRRNFRRRAEKELEAAKVKAKEARDGIIQECKLVGAPIPDLTELDKLIDAKLPPDPPIPSKIEDVDFDALEAQADAAFAEAEKSRAEHDRKELEHREHLRQKCKENNIDFDQLVLAAEKQGSSRPRFSAKEELQRLNDLRQTMAQEGLENAELNQKLDDPEFHQQLQKAEKDINDSYRKYAHFMPVPKPLTAAESKALRAELLAKLGKKETLATVDASGADLTGIDLSGADLTEALFVGANLSGAKFNGANLTGASLAHANCENLKAANANCAGASLGKANLQGADFSGSDLSKAVLTDAALNNARLAGANLKGADLQLNAKLAGANLSEARLPEAKILNGDLTGVCLAGADLTKSVVLETALQKADLSGAKLDGVTFIKVKADGASFANAQGKKFLIVHECSASKADFHGAVLPEALFRGLDLEAANFKGANLERADLSESNLRGADLSSVSAKQIRLNRTDLKGAKFAESDLFEGSLQKAILPDVSLAGSSLYSADLLKVTISDKTDFRGANLKKTLLHDGIPTKNHNAR